jgi:redox-sensing transcriptional repressor
MLLPKRTVERLSEYRRTLLLLLDQGRTHIFSHELAELHNITAVQVRRDIMFMGFSSYQRKGYDISDMVTAIGRIIDDEQGLNVAIVGVGNLGKAISHYFDGKRSKLNITAAFDNDMAKVGNLIWGVQCYAMTDLQKIVTEQNISIAMITVPSKYAQEVASALVNVGIKGILNFTSVQLNVPKNVILENYDMITVLEKVAYYVKQDNDIV